MHELSIAQEIGGIVLETATHAKAHSVTYIRLDIGRLAGVETESLRFALEMVLKETIAEKSLVEFHSVEGRGFCAHCGKEGVINCYFDTCPNCGSAAIEVIAGTEMKLSRMEVITD